MPGVKLDNVKRPPLPSLMMGREKKTEKVVVTVTDLEKQWIRYLAAKSNYSTVRDYMMSFIYQELEKIQEEEK